MTFTDDDLKRLKAMIEEPSMEDHPRLILFQDTVVPLLARLEAAEKFKGLLKIEIQSIIDAMLYTQENTITSDAHVRALKKIKAWRKAAGKHGA